MVVGFTGTRKGMTGAQMRVVNNLLTELRPSRVVHGDCLGADANFHNLVLNYRSRHRKRPCTIVLRPGHNRHQESPTRAYCEVWEFRFNPKPYLNRNKDIVRDADVLIACPSGMNEERRSGTWATIRYARKMDCPHYIVGPNGVLL